jgi:hypothetical protein
VLPRLLSNGLVTTTHQVRYVSVVTTPESRPSQHPICVIITDCVSGEVGGVLLHSGEWLIALSEMERDTLLGILDWYLCQHLHPEMRVKAETIHARLEKLIV